MRLFIAREAVDRHFSLAFPIVAPKSSPRQRVAAAMKAAPFYAGWYPRLWLPVVRRYGEFGRLAGHMRYVARAAKRLGRALFHAMLRFGPGLEKRQMVLFRAVDIGAELYAMTAACTRATMLARDGEAGAVDLADAFCRLSRHRVASLFRSLYGPEDRAMYRLAQRVLAGEHAWVERL
jgi:hypothetical protein